MTFRSFLATTALASLTALPALAQTPIRCSHQLPPQHDVAQVIDRWATEVETLSNGELDVQIFGANALAKPNENIPSVAKGSFECAFSVNFQWGKTLPAMNVTLRPYAFSDAQIWRSWPESAPAAYLSEQMSDKGLKNIAWLFQTRMSVFTSNEAALIAPSDFEGVKIRGLNPAFDSGLSAMNAAPSSMPGSEVYQALATGVIDAALTDVAAAHSRKYYEVQDHMMMTPIISVFFNGYMNQRFFDGLTETQRAALTEAGMKAAGWAVDAGLAAEEAAPAKLEAEGVTLHVATDAENEAIRAVMQPAFDAVFAKDGGASGARILELIDAMEH